MEWPDFDINGDLSVGVHRATLAEVIEHFGSGDLQREIVARRLARIYQLAQSTGQVARFIIFGSFITSKAAPNDVDIFMLMEDTFDSAQVTGEAAIIFDHLAAQNREGASVFWIRRMAAIGGEQSAIEDWQIRRDNKRRGIVEVVNHD
jgi:predicted nucleotidyltransferase